MIYGPTYITKSKHGIYYFQVRTTALLRQKHGFTGKLIRKSLKTKNKQIALARARFIWLLLFEKQIFQEMAKQDNIPSPEEQEIIMEEQRYIDKLLSTFIHWQLELDKIHPNDEHSKQVHFEFAPQEIELAIKYINDNNIDVNKLVYPDRQTDQSEVESRLANIENLLSKRQQSQDNELISKPLHEIFKEYLSEKAKSAKPTTLTSYKDDIGLFIELVSAKLSNQLTKVDINKYKSDLAKIPSHRNKKKKYRNKSLAEILAMKVPKDDLLSP